MKPPPGLGPWIEAWLSPPRFNVYMAAAGRDRARALDLYEWNSRLSAAVLRDLGHFEVALRNAYSRALDEAWAGRRHWLDDHASPLRSPLMRSKRGARPTDMNAKVRQAIDEARGRHGAGAPPEKIIPELPFGVWRHFTSNAHEKTLWVPVLHRAYPAGTSRASVDRSITRLNKLRNRAAHWEPLLRWPVAQSEIDLLTVCGMLNPELAAYLHDSSDVSQLLEQRPC